MKRVSELWIRLVQNEDGATTIEHGLMIALLAVISIAFVTLVGTSLSTLLGRLNTVTNAGTS